MGGNVADYLHIKDREFTIRASGPELERFGFTLPGKLLKSQVSIISFMLINVRDARLRIDINGTHVVLRNYGTSDVDRCIQEVCDTDILKSKGNNMVFSVSRGSCRIGDVVLWFQRRT